MFERVVYFQEDAIPSMPPIFPDQQVDMVRVSVCTAGPAKGHNTILDQKFLQDLANAGNAFPYGVRAYWTHDRDKSDKLGGELGRFKNFRVEGNNVYADLVFLRTPLNQAYIEHICAYARQDPTFFGTSITAYVSTEQREDGKAYATLKELISVDFVGKPAANPNGLFSQLAAEDKAEKHKAFREKAMLLKFNQKTNIMSSLIEKAKAVFGQSSPAPAVPNSQPAVVQLGEGVDASGRVVMWDGPDTPTPGMAILYGDDMSPVPPGELVVEAYGSQWTITVDEAGFIVSAAMAAAAPAPDLEASEKAAKAKAMFAALNERKLKAEADKAKAELAALASQFELAQKQLAEREAEAQKAAQIQVAQQAVAKQRADAIAAQLSQPPAQREGSPQLFAIGRGGPSENKIADDVIKLRMAKAHERKATPMGKKFFTQYSDKAFDVTKRKESRVGSNSYDKRRHKEFIMTLEECSSILTDLTAPGNKFYTDLIFLPPILDNMYNEIEIISDVNPSNINRFTGSSYLFAKIVMTSASVVSDEGIWQVDPLNCDAKECTAKFDFNEHEINVCPLYMKFAICPVQFIATMNGMMYINGTEISQQALLIDHMLDVALADWQYKMICREGECRNASLFGVLESYVADGIIPAENIKPYVTLTEANAYDEVRDFINPPYIPRQNWQKESMRLFTTAEVYRLYYQSLLLTPWRAINDNNQLQVLRTVETPLVGGVPIVDSVALNQNCQPLNGAQAMIATPNDNIIALASSSWEPGAPALELRICAEQCQGTNIFYEANSILGVGFRDPRLVSASINGLLPPVPPVTPIP